MSQSSETWSVVVRNQEAVVAALGRGECDGILPDEWLEPDNLVQTALEEGVFEWFEAFPDRRRRRTIEQARFCKVLLCGRLVDAPSIAETGRVVFHSATLLDKLGFNFRQVREGGRRTGDHRPFDEEALEDSFARLQSHDYLLQMVGKSMAAKPQWKEKRSTVWSNRCSSSGEI